MLYKLIKQENISPENLLKSIFDSAFYGLIIFKSVHDSENKLIDFRCLAANQIAAEYLGKNIDHIKGENLSTIYQDAVGQKIFNHGKDTTLNGQLVTFETQQSLKDSDRYFKYSMAKLNDGFCVSFQDITDKKARSQESSTREKKYRQLFEESIDAIFMVDENFDFLETNSSFQHLFGFTVKELKCMALGDIFSQKRKYQLFRKMLLSQGNAEEFEVTFTTSAGHKKPCLINCVTITDEVRGMKTYLGIIRDMTKRKQADRELFLAEKLSMTGKIARTIAHEVRNPLTNLTLALQQLKDEVPSEIEDADLYFNIIQRNADRIGNLITDLLNSSKTKELKLEKQNLNQQIRATIDLVKDRIKLQNISLKEQYDDNIPDIPLDRDQLKVALLNLLINAIEAMKPNEGKLTVSTSLDHERIILTIKDNGKGISKENLDSLFEPFFTAKKDGAGLGLTAVQNIIHSHKGKIDVQSKLGKGTAFFISFKPPL